MQGDIAGEFVKRLDLKEEPHVDRMETQGCRVMSAGRGRIAQEQIILGIAVAVFGMFPVVVPDFLAGSNVISIVQNISVLGILGIGIGIGISMAILGRGIDRSMVVSMSVTVA